MSFQTRRKIVRRKRHPPDDWRGSRRSARPTLRASGSCDRVETKSPDGDDSDEDEEHEHDELRLLEWRLGLRRRERVQGRHPTNDMMTRTKKLK